MVPFAGVIFGADVNGAFVPLLATSVTRKGLAIISEVIDSSNGY
jgi:hypothetical protein